MQKKLLLFEVTGEKLRQITSLCEKMGFEALMIDRKRYYETVGYLAGIPGLKRAGKTYRGRAFSREMIVFFGAGEDELDKFLMQYKEAQIEPVALKAVLTPYNMMWSCLQLFQELSAEHTAVNDSRA